MTLTDLERIQGESLGTGDAAYSFDLREANLAGIDTIIDI